MDPVFHFMEQDATILARCISGIWKAVVSRVFCRKTKGIDARFFMEKADISELPNAYKDASAVRAQIEKYDHAMIEDQVLPYGCIMAGDWEHNAS